MQQSIDSNTSKITREQAERVLKVGAFKVNGITVHIYKPEVLSELEPIKTDELLLHGDFVIHRVAGTLNAGQFGPSFVCEVGNTPAIATHSWLVNCDSVLGKQLRRFIDQKSIPLFVKLESKTVEKGANAGLSYETFATPDYFAAALDQAPAAKSDLDDLPF